MQSLAFRVACLRRSLLALRAFGATEVISVGDCFQGYGRIKHAMLIP